MTVRFFLPKCPKRHSLLVLLFVSVYVNLSKNSFLQRFPEHCSLKAGAKVSTFLIPAKYFKEKIKKTMLFLCDFDLNQAQCVRTHYYIIY